MAIFEEGGAEAPLLTGMFPEGRLRRPAVTKETQHEKLQQLRTWDAGHSHPCIQQGNGIKTEGPKDLQAWEVGGGNLGFCNTILST